ncbi:hypothetical protein DYH09_28100 [bacterium CPR1]|nr:hypothetical protein [bacterium CPR1]
MLALARRWPKRRICLAGPTGAAIGAGVGAGAGLIGRALVWKSGADRQFLHGVQQSVDRAVADNKDGSKTKIMVQNFTEGAIVGIGAGAREGWHIGVDAGKGAVSGIIDVVEGVAEGVWEAIRGQRK